LDLILGSLVVGVVLGLAFGLVAYRLAVKRRLPPEVDRLFEEVERRYLKVGIFHWEFVRNKLRWDPMYRALATEPLLPTTGRILDLGCGRGIALCLALARRGVEPGSTAPTTPPLDLVGLELRPRLAAVARRALGDSATVRRADVEEDTDPGLPPADAVLMLDVLHYLKAEAQERLLTRAGQALKPGGQLIVREADAGAGWRFSATRMAERLCAMARGHFDQRFHYRTSAEWRRVVERTGLEVEDSPLSAGTPFSNRLTRARRTSVPAPHERRQGAAPA
jgi:SAM-dependent methyltransferase